MAIVMKKAKAKQQARIFFSFQIALGLIAAVISLVFMLPNKFKATHRQFTECKKQHAQLSSDELAKACPTPYTIK